MSYKINGKTITEEELEELNNKKRARTHSRRWKPMNEDDIYFTVDRFGEVKKYKWTEHPNNKYLHLTGNLFPYMNAARSYAAFIKRVSKVTNAILNANQEWKPNWLDEKQKKYSIIYDHIKEEFTSCYENVHYEDLSLLPMCASADIANKVIRSYKRTLNCIRKYLNKRNA